MAHEAVVDFSVDALVGIVGVDAADGGVERRVLGHVERVGRRREERVQVVGVGDLWLSKIIQCILANMTLMI